jgi:hypothetical protein
MTGVYLQLGPTTVEQYRAVDAKLRAGSIPLAACRLHTAFKEGESLAVFDIWDSREAFEAFAASTAPILQEAGRAMPDPMFVEVIAFETP